MADVTRIEDPGDPRLDDYRGLRDPEGRRVTEQRAGILVAEGFTVLGRVVASVFPLRSVLCLENKVERVLAVLGDVAVPVYVVERSVMATVAGFDLHRGVVAVAERVAEPTLVSLSSIATTVLVLEGLNDPENLGAIARAARALGADALVLDPTCADPFARRTVRVSMGEILFLPVVRVASLPDALGELSAAGFATAAFTPDPAAVSLFEWAPPERVGLLFGAEGPGLTPTTIGRCDVKVRIPIRPEVDSLNVGHAVAVGLASVAERRLSAARAPTPPGG